jgi:molybdenum cofactor synthesis domain-containing protein
MLVSIVIVGDEILAGHVQDANSHFIATRVTTHGHRVARVVVVPDEPGIIADEIARDMASDARLVVVCGGLGPTHDDRTMEGVAAAMGRPLAPCAPLAARIEEIAMHVRGIGVSGDRFGMEGLRKMALAPQGAEALVCSMGVIPAVAVPDERADVVILPGPPREMQTVFLECVEPRFLEGTGEPIWREEITHPFVESVVAAMLGDVQERYPQIAIGSYPQADHVLIRVSGPEAETQAAAAAIREHLDELRRSEEGRRMLSFLEQRRRRRD